MANLDLPPKMAALRTELEGLVSDLDSRAAYGAVQLLAKKGLRIEVDNQVERVLEEPPTAGTVITAFDGQTLHERALGGFEPQAAKDSVQELLDNIKFKNGAEIDPGPQRRGDFVTPMEVPPESLSIKEKLERCRDLQRRARDLDEHILNVLLNYNEGNELSVFCNRSADLGQRVQRLSLRIIVVVAGEDGSPRYDFIRKAATGGWENLDFSNEEIQTVVDNALSLLSAERIEPGEYTIVTSPDVSGTICHESFGHGVETDMFLKERAKAVHYIDKTVGSPLVHIWDDPSLPGEYGSYYFDDEGWLASPTQIVEAGVFRRGLTDLYSATVLDLPRSANGRRQDFSRKAYARMSNTFFSPGDTPLSDLFAQVDHGVYLEKITSGMEDPHGWGLQVTCHYGHEIKNGRVTERMYAPISITGYVPQVLQSITGISDVIKLDAGNCGKGYKEWAFVGTGGPHMLMKARLG